jgi:hypothetical protein
MSFAEQMAARRLARWLTLASLVLWCSWELARGDVHPYASLNGLMTDHFSHMSAARLFPRVGRDLWRRPIAELLPEVRPDEWAELPADLAGSVARDPGTRAYQVPGWPRAKPVAASWTQFARPYPPGDLLLVAPVAALYQATDLSFTRANQLLIVLFLVYAHVALYFFVRDALGAAPGERRVRWLTLAAVYVYVIYYTLNGFYDAAALTPLILAVSYLGQRRGVAALLAYSVAAFIHYRAFFLAPWAVAALWLILRQREWRLVDGLALLATLALAVGSLYPFLLLGPTFRALPINNPLQAAGAAFDPLVLAGAGLLWILFGVWFARERAWLDLAVVAWMALLCLFLHQAYDWHVLVLLAWLGTPCGLSGRGRCASVQAARLQFLGSMLVLVFSWFMIRRWGA